MRLWLRTRLERSGQWWVRFGLARFLSAPRLGRWCIRFGTAVVVLAREPRDIFIRWRPLFDVEKFEGKPEWNMVKTAVTREDRVRELVATGMSWDDAVVKVYGGGEE